MNDEKLYTIAISSLPEGWEPVRIGIPNQGEYYLDSYGKITEAPPGCQYLWLIVQKTKPRRIVLEETDNECDEDETQWFANSDVKLYSDKIWREINIQDVYSKEECFVNTKG